MKTIITAIVSGILIVSVLTCITGCGSAQESAKDPNEVIQDKLGTNAAGATRQAYVDDTTFVSSASSPAVSSANSGPSTLPATVDESLALIQSVAQKAAGLNNYRYEKMSNLKGKYFKYYRLDSLFKSTEYDQDSTNSRNWTAVRDTLIDIADSWWWDYSYPQPEYPGSTNIRDLKENHSLSQSAVFKADEYKWHTTALLEMVNGYIQNGKDVKFTILKGTGVDETLSVTSITSRKANINLEIVPFFGDKKNYDVLVIEVLKSKNNGELFYFDETSGMLVCWAKVITGAIDFSSYYCNTSPNSVGAGNMSIPRGEKNISQSLTP